MNELKKQRFLILKKVYELSGANTGVMMNMFEDVGDVLGLDHSTIQVATQYLIDEGLLVARGLGGGIGISHDGIKEVEAALNNPEKPTKYFPAVNIINIGTMTGSAIQQGSPDAQQTISFGSKEQADLKEFLEELRGSIEQLGLEDEDRSELMAEISTLEAQNSSPKPKISILREGLKPVRAILEKVVANAISPPLIEKAQILWDMLTSG